MIHRSTICITSTRSETGIHTFFSNTCLVIRTVLVYSAFWWAIWWRTCIIVLTTTNWRSIDISAHRERPTGAWFTRIYYLRNHLPFFYTPHEWISFITQKTSAIRAMMMNSTLSVLSASSYTWVNTFLPDTCQIKRTFRTCLTLWSTVRWITDVFWQTTTNSIIIHYFTSAVWSTRWRVTRVFFNIFSVYAIFIRIANESINTQTFWNVVDRLTLSVDSTEPWTRVFAFIINTSFVIWAVRVQYTFWPTTFVWITKVASYTSTAANVVTFLTNSIRTTWIWNTWFCWFNWFIKS